MPKAVKVPDGLYALIAAQAADEDRPVAWVVRRLLTAALHPATLIDYHPEPLDRPTKGTVVGSGDQSEPCRHPLTRRVGKTCTACGATLR